MKKEAVVTGATGFIGSHLVRRLISEGWIVHAIVRPESGSEVLKGAGDNLNICCYDETMEEMTLLFSNISPSIVFHLASYFVSEHTASDIQRLASSNILLGLQLVEAMAASGVQRLVNAGTSWQHYNSKGYNPVNLYAATKEAFEALLRYYIEARSLNVVTLKMFDTYGPNDPRPKLFSFLRNASKGGQEIAMSPGEQLLDIVYIDDVIDAFMSAAVRLCTDECRGYEEYAISSDRRVTLKELVDIYRQVTARRLLIKWGGRPYRAREVMVPWKDGRCLPGWGPRISLEEGIRLTEMKDDKS